MLLMGRVAVAAPVLACDRDQYHFGERRADQRVEHDFVLENRGDEPLVLGEVKGCCGAVVTLMARTLPPGSNTICRLALSLRGRSGAVSKSVYVPSNDPATRYRRLTLTGTVIPASSMPQGAPQNTAATPKQDEPALATRLPDLVVTPSVLTLAIGANNSPPKVTRYLAVRSRSRTPFRIKGIDLPSKDMAGRLIAWGTSGWRIEITGISPVSGLNGVRITLVTDREDEPSLTIPVRTIP
jgi:hypothetical protein